MDLPYWRGRICIKRSKIHTNLPNELPFFPIHIFNRIQEQLHTKVYLYNLSPSPGSAKLRLKGKIIYYFVLNLSFLCYSPEGLVEHAWNGEILALRVLNEHCQPHNLPHCSQISEG
jgi:hypothetical protein